MKILTFTTAAYALMAFAFFVFHVTYLPMVTPGLAALRSTVWPIFWATGHPRGTPLGIPGEEYDDKESG